MSPIKEAVKKTPQKSVKKDTVKQIRRECVLPPLVTGQLFTIDMAVGSIDATGQRVINNILYQKHRRSLPDWWDYRTQVKERGEYVGSFCKRVSKYFYQTYQTKLSSDLLGHIGDVISEHTEDCKQYTIDYTNILDWKAGDFGDSSSCFFKKDAPALPVLTNYNVHAIRFYESQESSKGIARALILPYQHNDNQTYLVFNGYGHRTPNIARVMAIHLRISYRRINLRNMGTARGIVYTNSGRGFIIGYEHIIHGVDSIEMVLDNVKK